MFDSINKISRRTKEKLNNLEDKLNRCLVDKLSNKKAKFLEEILEAISTCYYTFNLTSDYVTTYMGHALSREFKELNPFVNFFIQNFGFHAGLTLFAALEFAGTFAFGYTTSRIIDKSFNKKYGKVPYIFRKLSVYIPCISLGTSHANATIHNLLEFQKLKL
ncbi:MAG: hypothetical protein OH319_04915 [Candidatus Parvarchaeota archaeon]|nr:hypothetical protein [Candidatus Jingweiarchaeum tengchongense]MCW1297677.1 hypothetical protein [Candidatus Jingweiarchaeum tengchongense]MCW1299688.1 hypothetical protein [Candidatus Jingweiarchaeum tengchongense]MCW1304344.1 hypothetical protein [Candidatus Jingweiarchaeum tengchongense]MCW1305673.1 hypothetical protein [Candidatus Jingweiarchaeum tengchongense]